MVTKADHESQKVIHAFILNALSDLGINQDEVGFIGEEDFRSTGKHMFIIDPLDGTSNYATGTEEFGVLIVYYFEHKLQSAVMYFPMKGLMYTSELGKGVYLEKNGAIEKIEIKKIPLHNSFLLSSMSYDDEIKAGIPQKILALKPLFRAVRMYGCIGLELVYILEGIAGAIIGFGCSVWDIAPGMLMLREVGYEMYDFEGNLLELDLSKPKNTYPFFACHPRHLERIMKYVSK
ncbi:hypothetical protein COY15_00025 [Candidatus Roizmanbacteria bacterium CG_4_10_14_0_2_um_filter_39_12]|nr:MAG: hypothetical protein COY15_00025 [Candidatus Roizmanbacteria bacterium CG_4_10_14_0_2_um_filter_39_12]